jgi:hypothetical protein
MYCDGFAQSIKLWNQETPLLGNGSVSTSQHVTMGAVISIARQQPARQWTGYVAIMWDPNRPAQNNRGAVFSVCGPYRVCIMRLCLQLRLD